MLPCMVKLILNSNSSNYIKYIGTPASISVIFSFNFIQFRQGIDRKMFSLTHKFTVAFDF